MTSLTFVLASQYMIIATIGFTLFGIGLVLFQIVRKKHDNIVFLVLPLDESLRDFLFEII